MAMMQVEIRTPLYVPVVDVVVVKAVAGSPLAHGGASAFRSFSRLPSQRYPRTERKPGTRRWLTGNNPGDATAVIRAGRLGRLAGTPCRSLAIRASRLTASQLRIPLDPAMDMKRQRWAKPELAGHQVAQATLGRTGETRNASAWEIRALWPQGQR